MTRNTPRDTSAHTWRNPSRDGQPWASRCRNRITCKYSPEEKRAIDWLSRCPCPDKLPASWKPLANTAARAIAKALNLKQLAALVALRQTIAATD